MELSELDVRLEGGLALIEDEARRLLELGTLVGSTRRAAVARVLQLLTEREQARARLERILVRAEHLAGLGASYRLTDRSETVEGETETGARGGSTGGVLVARQGCGPTRPPVAGSHRPSQQVRETDRRSRTPGRRLELLGRTLGEGVRAHVRGVPEGASLELALAHWRRCCECRLDAGQGLVLLEELRSRPGNSMLLFGMGAAGALGLFAVATSSAVGAGGVALVLAGLVGAQWAERRRVRSWRLGPEAIRVDTAAEWFPIPVDDLGVDVPLEVRKDGLWIGGAWSVLLPALDASGLREAIGVLANRRRRRLAPAHGGGPERGAGGGAVLAESMGWLEAAVVPRVQRTEACWDFVGVLELVRFRHRGSATSWVSPTPAGLVLLYRGELSRVLQQVLGLAAPPASASAGAVLSLLEPAEVATIPSPAGVPTRTVPWPAEFRRVAGGLVLDLPAGRALEVRGDEELLAAVEAARHRALIGVEPVR